MGWLSVIGTFFQLVLSIMQNQFQRDAAEKKRKDDLHAKLADAIKNRDANAVNDILDSLR